MVLEAMADADRRVGPFDELEALSDDARRDHLAGVLRAAVRCAWAVPLYREKLRAAGLGPDDVGGLDDLGRIPVTSKKETRGTTFGAGTIPLEEARRIFVSPGPMFYASQRRTDPPPERGRTPLARAFHAMGFRENDIVLNTFSYHLTPGGFGLEDQLTAAGCAVVPAGPQNTETQVQILAAIPVTGYVGTPTFLKLLCDRADGMGVDPRTEWRLRVAFVTAERLPEELRDELEERTGATVRQIYGSADGLLPAYECWARTGMHPHPDQILEVLDPETGEPARPGDPGHVVATLANPNRPLLRFANLDLVALRDDPCPCGRTGPRIARFVGRADDSTKVRGMFVYPEQIAEAVVRFPEVARWQAVVARDARGADDLRVLVETAGPAAPGLAERLAEAVRGLVRLRAAIEIVPAGTIAADARRLEDRR